MGLFNPLCARFNLVTHPNFTDTIFQPAYDKTFFGTIEKRLLSLLDGELVLLLAQPRGLYMDENDHEFKFFFLLFLTLGKYSKNG
jgi:hypothetical protein